MGRSKYVCKYKSDYYYLLAAELGHREALEYIVNHKIVTYKPNLSAFSYKDRSVNYARVKFLSVCSTIRVFFAECTKDDERVVLGSRIMDVMRELAPLGYAPAQIVMHQMYDGRRGNFLHCSVGAANWLSKYYKSPMQAAQLAAQLKEKGIFGNGKQ